MHYIPVSVFYNQTALQEWRLKHHGIEKFTLLTSILASSIVKFNEAKKISNSTKIILRV